MKRLKKFSIIMISLYMVFLSGCSKVPKNEIKAMPLTEKEQDIINLISNSTRDILLFSYQIEDAYHELKVWVETYKNGEIVDSYATGISISESGDRFLSKEGEFSVIIEHNPDFKWSFDLRNEGTKVSCESEPNKNYLTSGRINNGIDSSLVIEDGKEVILYYSLFSDGGLRTYENQEFINNPDVLKEYAYAHIIKFRFDK